MIRTFSGCCVGLLALQLSPVGLQLAQAATEIQTGQEEVTVDGPYTIREDAIKGFPTRELLNGTSVSVSRDVGYSDLDLSNPADADKLRARVKDAARDTCAHLDRRFPQWNYATDHNRFHCIKDATSDALARVDVLTGRTMARADTGAAAPLAR